MALPSCTRQPKGRAQPSLRDEHRRSPRRHSRARSRSRSPSVKRETLVESQAETTHMPSPPTYPSPASNLDIRHTSLSADNPPPANPAVTTRDIHSPPLVRCSPVALYELFITLERTCKDAASGYWHSQSHLIPAQCLVHRNSRNEPAGAQSHPYASDPYDHGVFESSLQLMDYMQRISQMLWDRAIRSGDHAEMLEAVHRMGYLYLRGNKVRAAAEWRIGEGVGLGLEASTSMAVMVDRAAVLDVTRASRDMVSWLLSEDGKRKVEQLEEWDFGEGIMEQGSSQGEGIECSE